MLGGSPELESLALLAVGGAPTLASLALLAPGGRPELESLALLAVGGAPTLASLAPGGRPELGDGAGILLQIPDAFLRAEMNLQGVTLPKVGDYGVGMIFLPRDAASRQACEEAVNNAIVAEGQILLGWRDVPCDNSGLAKAARDIEHPRHGARHECRHPH